MRLADGGVEMLDQTRLPGEVVTVPCAEWPEVVGRHPRHGRPRRARRSASPGRWASPSRPAGGRRPRGGPGRGAPRGGRGLRDGAADGRQPRAGRSTPRPRLAAAHPGPPGALAADLAAAARALHADEVERCERMGRPRPGAAVARRPDPHPLQRRGARDRRLRDGARRGAGGVRRRPDGAGGGRRDPAAAAGRAAHRLGARARGHPVHAHRRLHGGDDDGRGAGHARRGRRRPHRRQRRRGQQDRHLRRGGPGPRARHPGHRGRAHHHARPLDAGRGRRRHRGARRRRGARPGPLRPPGRAGGRRVANPAFDVTPGAARLGASSPSTGCTGRPTSARSARRPARRRDAPGTLAAPRARRPGRGWGMPAGRLLDLLLPPSCAGVRAARARTPATAASPRWSRSRRRCCGGCGAPVPVPLPRAAARRAAAASRARARPSPTPARRRRWSRP